MIEEGALDGVDAVFGLHLWQSLPTGSDRRRQGPDDGPGRQFHASSFKGRGGHGSMPHTTVDPILVAAQIVVNLPERSSAGTSTR